MVGFFQNFYVKLTMEYKNLYFSSIIDTYNATVKRIQAANHMMIYMTE